MIDLYTILGIPRDASPQAIRSAYRLKTKACHPDAGGDRQAWDDIALAHEILSDPARRAKYDATGSIDRSAPDNSTAQLMAALATLFDTAMLGVLGSGQDPTMVNMLDVMIRLAKGEEDKITRANDQFAKNRRLLTKMLGRFKAKDGEPNHMETILQAQITDIDQKLEVNRLAIKQTQIPRLYLEGCKFKSDDPWHGTTAILRERGFTHPII